MAASRNGGPGGTRERARRVVRAFEEHDLLTYASAISFQILSAIVPFLLFGFGLLGFLDLREVWRDDIAPELKDSASAAAFTVIDDTVERVLNSKQLFWVSAGALLAVWQISGAVRAVMNAFDAIYRARRRRPWRERMLVSIGLSIAVGTCLLLAIAVVTLTPLAYGHVGAALGAMLFALRWLAAGALLLLVVGLLVRFAPATPQPIRWVSFGSLLVIGSWVITSIAFGAYLRGIASYSSIFGSLASIVILLAYLYLSTVVFLAGAQVDAMVRSEVRGRPDGS